MDFMSWKIRNDLPKSCFFAWKLWWGTVTFCFEKQLMSHKRSQKVKCQLFEGLTQQHNSKSSTQFSANSFSAIVASEICFHRKYIITWHITQRISLTYPDALRKHKESSSPLPLPFISSPYKKVRRFAGPLMLSTIKDQWWW